MPMTMGKIWPNYHSYPPVTNTRDFKGFLKTAIHNGQEFTAEYQRRKTPGNLRQKTRQPFLGRKAFEELTVSPFFHSLTPKGRRDILYRVAAAIHRDEVLKWSVYQQLGTFLVGIGTLAEIRYPFLPYSRDQIDSIFIAGGLLLVIGLITHSHCRFSLLKEVSTTVQKADKEDV